ncbi:MAG: BufA2 family periplasmic bufferin-type metallophore [Ostreibacterium sp.]
MKITQKTTGFALATTAALLLVGCTNSNETAMKKDMAGQSADTGKCYGINTCKGQSACATSESSCKGHNSCKGKGWMAKTHAACDAVGGKFKL